MELKENKETSEGFIWKKEYSIVLVLNIFYILVFYFLMKTNL